MVYPSLTFLFAAAVFLAAVITFALRPATAHKVVIVIVITAALTALAFYGFGYGMAATTPLEAVVAACRAMFSTTFMFVGRENYSELCRVAPWFAGSIWLQILFWLTNICALYATASTVLGTIGTRLLRRIRLLALPYGKVCMLYDPEGASLSAVRTLSKLGYRPLIVCGEKADAIEETVSASDGVVWNDARITEDGAWLARLGIRPGRHTLEIICCAGNDGQTKDFLMRVVDALRAQRISAAQVHVCAVCQSEVNFDFLSRTQIEPGKYLAADIYTRNYLAATRVITEASPHQAMRFDDLGKADGDFCAMIIGFGSLGQNVLRLLVRNGQFCASRFSALVVDRDLNGCAGAFTSLYADLLSRYNVSFTEADARSKSFVKLLDSAAPKLRYIVICTGNDETDREVANQICTYRMCGAARFSPRMVLAVCGRDAVTICGGKARRSAKRGEETEPGRESDMIVPVVRIEELLEGRPDRLARAINAIYLKNAAFHSYPDDPAARDAYYRNGWYSMSSISRMSCRATAQAIPALLAAAGVKEGDAEGLARCRARLDSDADFRLSLSQMEHLRWNAFESSIGVVQMPAAEFERRLARALAQGETALSSFDTLKKQPSEGGEVVKKEADAVYAAFRTAFGAVRKEIPTYGVGGLHVCLTDWDDLAVLWDKYAPLEALSRKVELAYAEAVHPNDPARELPAAPDFQELDTNNVLGILDWLGENRAV